MSNDPTDSDLSERFRELRAHDDARVPAFEQVLQRVPTRTSRLRLRMGWAAGGVGLAAVALWLAVRPPAPALDADAIALTTWNSPTDFLLVSPDESLLRLAWVPTATADFGRFDLKRE